MAAWVAVPVGGSSSAVALEALAQHGTLQAFSLGAAGAGSATGSLPSKLDPKPVVKSSLGLESRARSRGIASSGGGAVSVAGRTASGPSCTWRRRPSRSRFGRRFPTVPKSTFFFTAYHREAPVPASWAGCSGGREALGSSGARARLRRQASPRAVPSMTICGPVAGVSPRRRCEHVRAFRQRPAHHRAGEALGEYLERRPSSSGRLTSSGTHAGVTTSSYLRHVRSPPGVSVRIPDEVEHRFRTKWNGDFGRSGTSIPGSGTRIPEVEHRFRTKWNSRARGS